jgi:GntR family transcriptional regulator
MFQIDVMSRTPVYEQLIRQTEDFILKGILKSGDKMPSVRSLSTELAVNPNTIQKALSELDRTGLIQSVPGRGSFITEEAPQLVRKSMQGGIDDMQELLKKLQLAGVPRDAIIKCVDEVYGMATNNIKGDGND